MIWQKKLKHYTTEHNVTFNQMLLASTPSLKLYAYKFTQDQEEANDPLQDTLLRAIRYVNLFKEGTNIRGWLFTIMRNAFINSYRKGIRKQAIITQEEEISSANLLPSAQHNHGEGKFAMRDIQNTLSSIPKQLSDPFIRYLEGYKYHEIADELQIPLGTVKTRIHQARQLLQRKLKPYAKAA